MSKDKPALIVRNKTATRNYKLGDSFQAGIALEGWEVKSLRNGKVDIKDSYVTFKNDEAWLIGAKIDPPASLKNFNADPTRSRKLLLHKKEIYQLQKLKGEKASQLFLPRYIGKKTISNVIYLPVKVKNYMIRDKILKKEIGKEIKEEFLKILENDINNV